MGQHDELVALSPTRCEVSAAFIIRRRTIATTTPAEGKKKITLDGTLTEDNPHDADDFWLPAPVPNRPRPNYASSTVPQAQPVASTATRAGRRVRGQRMVCRLFSDQITTVWRWLADLNAGTGFAGHTDWRLPTTKELSSIVAYDSPVQPAVGHAFSGSRCGAECTAPADLTCSCTAAGPYWSATSSGDGANRGFRRRQCADIPQGLR
jgi:hypothetical protein